MPMTTTRITAGPLERMLLDGSDIYPNDATAELAMDQLADFRRRRTAGRWKEYPILAVDVDGHDGRLALVMQRDAMAELTGTSSGVAYTAIRLEFERFTIAESQHRVRRNVVESELVVGTGETLPDTACTAMIGRPVAAVIDLPPSLTNLFDGLVVETARVRGAGTAYGFAPAEGRHGRA